MHTRKQSTVTCKVFTQSMLLCTCDVIEIKMIYQDLPYYEGMRANTHHEYKLHENNHEIMQTNYLPLENGP